MRKISKKFIACMAALVVALTGFAIDSSKSEAGEMRSGDVYYEILKAPNQNNDLAYFNNINYKPIYRGQKLVITGVDINGKKYSIDCLDDDILSSDREITRTPESKDDYLVTYSGYESGEYSLSDGKLSVSGTYGLRAPSLYVYTPKAVLDEEGNETGAYAYDNNSNRKYIDAYDLDYYFVDIQISDSDGNLVASGYDEMYLTKAVNQKATYVVETVDSKFSVSSSDPSVAAVTKTADGFVADAKSIGVTHITVTDNNGHSTTLEYMVVKPTPGNATKNEAASNSGSSNSASSSNSSNSASSASSAPTDKPKQVTSVNSEGQTVNTFKTYDGFNTSLEGLLDIVPDGATFSSKDIEKTSEYYVTVNEYLEDFFTNEFGVEQSYYYVGKMLELDLADTSGALIHQLDGYVTVSMDMPSDITIGANQKLLVYRVAEDGQVYACPTVVKDGVIQFATNHFSTYVFVVADADVADAATAANTSKTTKSPKTGEE